jgi:hypothetical protein
MFWTAILRLLSRRSLVERRALLGDWMMATMEPEYEVKRNSEAVKMVMMEMRAEAFSGVQ